MIKALQQQLSYIRNHTKIFICIVCIALLALYTGYRHHTLLQAVAYLIVMWVCMLVVDIYAVARPAKADLPVRQPKKELWYIIVCTAIGILALMLRFNILPWDRVQGIVRLAIFAPMMLFVFPVVLAIIMLIIGYKPRDLGVRLHGLWIALPIIVIVFVVSRLVAPQAFTWAQIKQEVGGNVVMILVTGLISAGLSEEFWKMLAFTRLGAVMHNRALGWLIAAIVWALMHAPKWYGEGGNLFETFLSCMRIVPIGLMWSYITYRTKNVLPATLVHGTNFWGMQNF